MKKNIYDTFMQFVFHWQWDENTQQQIIYINKTQSLFYVGYTQMPVLYWTLDCYEQPLQGVVENQFTLFHPQNFHLHKKSTV